MDVNMEVCAGLWRAERRDVPQRLRQYPAARRVYRLQLPAVHLRLVRNSENVRGRIEAHLESSNRLWSMVSHRFLPSGRIAVPSRNEYPPVSHTPSSQDRNEKCQNFNARIAFQRSAQRPKF